MSDNDGFVDMWGHHQPNVVDLQQEAQQAIQPQQGPPRPTKQPVKYGQTLQPPQQQPPQPQQPQQQPQTVNVDSVIRPPAPRPVSEQARSEINPPKPQYEAIIPPFAPPDGKSYSQWKKAEVKGFLQWLNPQRYSEVALKKLKKTELKMFVDDEVEKMGLKDPIELYQQVVSSRGGNVDISAPSAPSAPPAPPASKPKKPSKVDMPKPVGFEGLPPITVCVNCCPQNGEYIMLEQLISEIAQEVSASLGKPYFLPDYNKGGKMVAATLEARLPQLLKDATTVVISTKHPIGDLAADILSRAAVATGGMVYRGFF